MPRLGNVLVERGYLTLEQLNDCLAEQRSGGGKLLGEILVDGGYCSDDQVTECLAFVYGVPYAKLEPRIADPNKDLSNIKILKPPATYKDIPKKLEEIADYFRKLNESASAQVFHGCGFAARQLPCNRIVDGDLGGLVAGPVSADRHVISLAGPRVQQ